MARRLMKKTPTRRPSDTIYMHWKDDRSDVRCQGYLDARALEVFQAGDADFRRASWYLDMDQEPDTDAPLPSTPVAQPWRAERLTRAGRGTRPPQFQPTMLAARSSLAARHYRVGTQNP
eukprot:scaffold12910_cov102-Isochrysis_galbana.AAC.1